MRFYNQQHRFYAGVDLHARTLSLCVLDADGNLVISARNTSALYELDTQTGQIVSEIGGKHPTFKLGAGASTAYQHDAYALPNGTISIFDNGGIPRVHSQSRPRSCSPTSRRACSTSRSGSGSST